MPEPNRDDLFRQIAESYVDTWGKSLQQELEDLNRESPVTLTPGLDRKVLGGVKARKRRRLFRGAGTLAACLLLAILLPRMLPETTADSSREQAAPSAVAPSMEMAGSAPQAARQEAGSAALALPEAPATADTPLQDIPPVAAQAAPEEQAEGGAPALGGSANPDALAALPPMTQEEESPSQIQSFAGQGFAPLPIPLPFSLPEGFTIRSIHWAGTQNIYDIQGPLAQPIVLTAEYPSVPLDTRGLAPIKIGSRIAFGSAQAGQYRLMVEQEGVLYEATSPDNMKLLLDLFQQLG